MATFSQATGKTGLKEFIASMNHSKGFARLSRYAVVITPPGNLENLKNIAGQSAIDQLETGQKDEHNNIFRFQSLGKQVARQLTLHCNSISMPGHDLQAQDMQHGSAPGRQIVQSHDYAGTIAASFYLDSHLRERHYFEQWQKMAVSTTTHKANYYNDYIGSMEIFQLDTNNEITYGIKATEVYPSTIGGIEYSYDSANQVATQAVSFEYRQWYNLTEDAIHTYRNSDSYNYLLKTYGMSADEKATKLKQESNRQRHLRTPEVDIDRHAANRKSAARDQRLLPSSAKR